MVDRTGPEGSEVSINRMATRRAGEKMQLRLRTLEQKRDKHAKNFPAYRSYFVVRAGLFPFRLSARLRFRNSMGQGREIRPMSTITPIVVLAVLLIAPAVHASGNCTRMKATDTLIFYGHPQHAERFVECSVGRWPNVYSVFRKLAIRRSHETLIRR